MQIETMEARRLLASDVITIAVGDAAQGPGGTPAFNAKLTRTGSLYLDGSTAADRITLREIKGLIQIEARMTIDGRYFHLASGQLSYSAKEVKRIFIDGRSGRDIVDVQFSSSTPVTLQEDPKDTLLRQSYITIPESGASHSPHATRGEASYYVLSSLSPTDPHQVEPYLTRVIYADNFAVRPID